MVPCSGNRRQRSPATPRRVCAQVILSLVGATGAVLVKFLMPTAAALKLLDVSIGEKVRHFSFPNTRRLPVVSLAAKANSYPRSHLFQILLWFVLLTGLVLGGISTATVISDWASGNV